MILTLRWLTNRGACIDAVEAFKIEKNHDDIFLLNKMIKTGRLDWATWLISRRLKKKDRIRYAIYAAYQVIGIYEKKHPDDDRPRAAIQAAEKCLKNPINKNKAAAYAAADAAAVAAAYAAYAAGAAYAANAAYAAKHKMKTKIIRYGIKLLKESYRKET